MVHDRFLPNPFQFTDHYSLNTESIANKPPLHKALQSAEVFLATSQTEYGCERSDEAKLNSRSSGIFRFALKRGGTKSGFLLFHFTFRSPEFGAVSKQGGVCDGERVMITLCQGLGRVALRKAHVERKGRVGQDCLVCLSVLTQGNTESKTFPLLSFYLFSPPLLSLCSFNEIFSREWCDTRLW
jgi:hypothetical protein